jgi:photosynthetic reaction center H subunit
MRSVFLAGGLDVAELVFFAFFLFFIGLVIYLRQEDRREGYPKEYDDSGRIFTSDGPATMPRPKAFRLPFDRGYAVTPRRGEEPAVALRRFDRFSGAPYLPVGDPLVGGAGPAAYAMRAPWPDLDMEGRLRIVPIGADHHFAVSPRDPALVGMRVTGADKGLAGMVSDVWIDRSDRMIRYLSVALTSGGTVLAPMAFASVDRRRNLVHFDSISAAQFTNVPQPATAGEITRREEDMIQGYFGGGYLYGLPGRTEPLL